MKSIEKIREHCTNCGSLVFTEGKVNKVFSIDGEVIVVDKIPAKICKKCGDESFTRDTLAHIQSIIYGKPKKYIKAKAFEYA
ncbi:MAG: YgiT-type zinc finger protein [Ignavibacteriae bacterium]|nr:YgiT-type zinc finger protein [Ignavibacteriota bacterium]